MNNRIYYHGTNRHFDRFDIAKSQSGSLIGPAMYLTDDPEMAKWYGVIIKTYAVPAHLNLFISETRAVKDDLYARALGLYEEATGTPLVVDPETMGYMKGIEPSYVFWRDAKDAEIVRAKTLLGQALKKEGYDGVKENDTIAIFDPTLAKPL
jgi:hypothetical protein